MSRSSKLVLISVLVCSMILQSFTGSSASAVSPSDWRAGRIIDDTVFMNKNDMTIAQVQQFLDSKMPFCDTWGTGYYNGVRRSDYGTSVGNPPPFTCLKDYKEVPKTSPGNWIPESNYGRTDGWAPVGSKSAAEIIWDAAQAYNINPKVLLVTLQKESGLVTDDWPLKRQLVYAMGAHCPDSGPGGSANCDVNYSGFSIQMRESAELFRYYLDNMDQPWWTHKKPFQVNSIRYDVEVSCGSSNVLIETRATAALYTYTPYQPTPEALAAGYGSAEPCGAYGNRNFWLFYNDWFGSTLDKSFILAKSSSSSAQYVIYNGLKQLIPTPEIKLAWGLDTTPLETVDQAYLDALTNGPNLDIVFRVNSGTQLYVADSGKRYAIPTVDAWRSWKLDEKAISNVPTGLGITPADGGVLSYTVRQTGQSAVYMLDGLDQSGQAILRRYDNPDVLFGIEGAGAPIITVSTSLFSTIDNNIQADITSTKIAYGGQEYQAVDGQKLPQSAAIAPLYPGVATNVTNITAARFITGPWMTPFVRASTAAEVYVAQNGTRHHIASPDILNNWMGGGLYISVVNQNFLNLVSNTNIPVTSTVATDGTATYLMFLGGKITIAPSLAGAYQTSDSFSASQVLMSGLPVSGASAHRFVRNSATGQIFLIDNSSRLNIISSIPMAELWGVSDSNITNIPPITIDDFTVNSSLLTAHVSDGVDTYAMLNGTLKRTTNTNATWQLPAAQVFNDGTLSSLPSSGELAPTARNGNRFYRIFDGKAHMTTDARIAAVWDIAPNATDSSRLINTYLPNLYMLTPSILSNGNYYVADKDKLHRVTDAEYRNLNMGSPAMFVDHNIPGFTASDWVRPLFKNSQGGVYVVDGGKLRTFGHIIILNHWTGNGSLPVITVSNEFISLFTLSSPIERAIKPVDSSKIYSAEQATKRWITDPYVYRDLYAPYTNVSPLLIEALPTGSNL